MSSTTYLLIGLGLVLFVLITRSFKASFDRERIKRYVEERGGTLINASWRPFGRGRSSLGERFYKVTYIDNCGNTREATGRTNMVAGVFLLNDAIVKTAPLIDEPSFPRPTTANSIGDNSASALPGEISLDPQAKLDRHRIENERLHEALRRRAEEEV